MGTELLNHSLDTLCFHWFVFQSYVELVVHLYYQTENVKVTCDPSNSLSSVLLFFDFFVGFLGWTVFLKLPLVFDLQNI